ncbi:MAG: iron ABC transporter permease [Rhizobiaceae bacterium MnEN-MB40S]|nr:MAG: iron ABC transporter permease [Rhizobiaceae bacterium MnEN-MB40S]
MTKLLVGVLFALLFIASLFTGVANINPGSLFSQPDALWILLVSRLPRTLAVIITGSSLAISGMILQMLARNRFVEPATAGTGQGAAVGIIAVTILAPQASLMVKMIAAVVAALGSTLIFLLLIRRLPVDRPLLIPLVALVYGGFVSAIAIFFAYQLDLLQYLEVWMHGMSGEFSGIMMGRYELLWIAAVLSLLAYFVADQFTIIGLGKEMTLNLGLGYRQIVAFGMMIVSVVTAVSVVTVGMIPFVGLVVPNIASRIMGDNLRASLPWVAVLGSMLVLASDLLARTIRYPYEVPVSIIFGVFGACVFLWLLFARPVHAR